MPLKSTQLLPKILYSVGVSFVRRFSEVKRLRGQNQTESRTASSSFLLRIIKILLLSSANSSWTREPIRVIPSKDVKSSTAASGPWALKDTSKLTVLHLVYKSIIYYRLATLSIVEAAHPCETITSHYLVMLVLSD